MLPPRVIVPAASVLRVLSPDVDLQHALDELVRHGVDRSGRREDPGVVDEDVERIVTCGERHRPAKIRWVGDVAAHERRRETLGDCVGSGHLTGGVHVGKGDVRPGGRQSHRDRCTDALRRPRHQRTTPAQVDQLCVGGSFEGVSLMPCDINEWSLI